jgi:hypothetical protein
MQDTDALKFGILLDPASLRGYILTAISVNINDGSYRDSTQYSCRLARILLTFPPTLPQQTITVLFLIKDVFTAGMILEKIES